MGRRIDTHDTDRKTSGPHSGTNSSNLGISEDPRKRMRWVSGRMLYAMGRGESRSRLGGPTALRLWGRDASSHDKVAISDDRRIKFEPPAFLFLLHLNLEERFAAGRTVIPSDGLWSRLPAPTAVGFANGRRDPKRVSGEDVVLCDWRRNRPCRR